MITRLASQSYVFLFASKYGPKSFQISRLHNFNMRTFSSGKKQKKLEKGEMKRKSYNLDGIDKTKLPEHLKVAYELKKQTQNMEVVSEAQLENEIIVSQIKRQRQQIQSLPSLQELKNISTSQIEKLLFGLSAVNVGIYGFLYLPILANHMYWLGIYSSIFLYPSLIFTTSISIGINLAYLILRQGLFMSEKVEEIKKVDITSASMSLYFQMLLVSLQFFSLATSVSIPLTLLGLNQNYKTLGLYAILFCLLSVNAHLTLQKRLFINRGLHISTQAGCFFVLFLLSAFTYVQYNMGDKKEEKQKENKRNFIRGQNKLKNIWRIEKQIINKNEKITDQLNLDQTEETDQGGQK